MKNFFVAHLIATMNRLLRRTLVRSGNLFNKLQVSLLLVLFSFIAGEVKAQQATWIW